MCNALYGCQKNKRLKWWSTWFFGWSGHQLIKNQRTLPTEWQPKHTVMIFAITLTMFISHFRCTPSPNPPQDLIATCLTCLATVALRDPEQVTDNFFLLQKAAFKGAFDMVFCCCHGYPLNWEYVHFSHQCFSGTYVVHPLWWALDTFEPNMTNCPSFDLVSQQSGGEKNPFM